MAQQENDGLPTGWKTKLLGDAASIITKGTTPTTAGYQYIDEGIPFIKVENIIDNRVAINSVSQFISEDAHAALARSQFVEDDVLFSIAGTIGKTALVKKEYLPCNTNQAVAIIRGTNDLLVPDFLNYQLINFAQKIARENSRGGAMNNVSLGDLKNINAMVAPLQEQKRIVEKLDSLLAQVDTIQQRLNTLPNIIKRFRQSVLAAAVSGKLTEQWRGENQCDEWKWLTIGDVSTVATGSTPKRTESTFWESSDVPWLTSSVTGNGFCDKATQFVSNKAVKECRLKVFPSGSLLLAMYGEGKTRGQVTEIRIEATCNQACAVILVDETKISKSFVKLRLLENYEATRMAAEGGNQPNLNLSKVRNITIPLPSTTEQTEIVRLVEQYFALADTLEKHLKNAKQRVDNLTQAILAKAFKGELVPQDPSDEPADKLLERIKATREEAEKLEKVAKASARKAAKASKSVKQ